MYIHKHSCESTIDMYMFKMHARTYVNIYMCSLVETMNNFAPIKNHLFLHAL